MRRRTQLEGDEPELRVPDAAEKNIGEARGVARRGDVRMSAHVMCQITVTLGFV